MECADKLRPQLERMSAKDDELRRTERHIAEVRRLIVAERERVTRLRAEGADAAVAE